MNEKVGYVLSDTPFLSIKKKQQLFWPKYVDQNIDMSKIIGS